MRSQVSFQVYDTAFLVDSMVYTGRLQTKEGLWSKGECLFSDKLDVDGHW